MIITSCPYCDNSIMTPYESGASYKAEKCDECKKVFWVQMTTIGGETVSHEHFKENIVPKQDWDKVDEIAKDRAERED